MKSNPPNHTPEFNCLHEKRSKPTFPPSNRISRRFSACPNSTISQSSSSPSLTAFNNQNKRNNSLASASSIDNFGHIGKEQTKIILPPNSKERKVTIISQANNNAMSRRHLYHLEARPSTQRRKSPNILINNKPQQDLKNNHRLHEPGDSGLYVKSPRIQRPVSLRSHKSTFPYESLRKSADDGDVNAQYELGDIYFCGKNVMLDRIKAVRYFQMAAKQGHSKAQEKLGEIYFYGWGVSKDSEKAAKYLKDATEQNEINAFSRYGECCLKGMGVEADAQKAAEIFLKGSIVGCSECSYQYGLLAQNGNGIPQNLDIAMEFFLKAEKYGHQQAKAAIVELVKKRKV